MTGTLARRAALAGVAVTAALALTACGDDGHPSPGMHGTPGTTGPAASASGAAAFGDADAMFAQMMIPHHRQAVEMADLAATRAADPEVKRLAAEIKAAQAPEIATMSGWLSAWGRPVPSPGAEMPHMDHGMPGMMTDAEMTKLAAASGREFDRQFLTMMIAHHEGAVTMARDELSRGVNAEAKALAGQIVATQQAEIDTMRRILGRL
ncbi:DUF305 domain-containing protein [Micromonospora citrea]|uniref:DUF305 domain-containing protein n=1 Tax=Micromonospora citrea TaxID=47855 RepID=UPI000B89D350|nr:DUF305 domain-containing protein [Micromonospora citrea]